jgi:hypothetical protein
MDADTVEAKVAAFKAQHQDVTDAEETRYRDHLKNGTTFIFRPRVVNDARFGVQL